MADESKKTNAGQGAPAQSVDLVAEVSALKEKLGKMEVESAQLASEVLALKARINEVANEQVSAAPDSLERRIAEVERIATGKPAEKAPQPGRGMQFVYPKSGEPMKVTADKAAELLKDTANYADTPAKWAN